MPKNNPHKKGKTRAQRIVADRSKQTKLLNEIGKIADSKRKLSTKRKMINTKLTALSNVNERISKNRILEIKAGKK